MAEKKLKNKNKNDNKIKKKSDKISKNWGEKKAVKKVKKSGEKPKKNALKLDKKGGLFDAKKTKKLTKKQKMMLIFAGGIIGFLNGFFGGGGGMICVPILQKVLNLDAKHSHATAILVIFPLSLISAFIYVINGYISSLPLLTIGLGVVLGGVLGSFALKILPPKAVRVIFAIIMFVGGIKLIIWFGQLF